MRKKKIGRHFYASYVDCENCTPCLPNHIFIPQMVDKIIINFSR